MVEVINASECRSIATSIIFELKIHQMAEIKIVQTPEDMHHCFEVIHTLRPHLDEAQTIDCFHRMQLEGYQAIWVEENGRAMAYCGFRRITHFFSGPAIYIDDLVTLPEARKKGYGAMLLDRVIEIGKQEGLETIRLDSGHHRHDAHRLYLNKGFHIHSHNFSLPLRS